MSALGEVLEVEDPMVDGNLLRSFMRVRVCFNVNNPLPTGCWVQRRDLPKLWAFFRYEKLQDLCYNCGIVGHEQKECEKERKMAVLDSESPRYGPGLSVPIAKSLEEIVAEKGRWFMVGQKQEGGRRRESSGENSRLEEVPARRSWGERLPGKSQGGADVTSILRREKNQKDKIDDSLEGSFSCNSQNNYDDLTEVGCSKQNLKTGPSWEGMMSGQKKERMKEIEGGKKCGVQTILEMEVQQNISASHGREKDDTNQIGREVGLGENINFNPTLVDLKEKRPRPGLGPKQIEDLDIEKEDIGLKEKVVLLDYLSPPESPIKYQGANMTQLEVDKCRGLISAHKANTGKQKQEIQHSREGAEEPEAELGYYVEFPEEDGGEKSKEERKLSKEEEMALVMVVNKTLSIKRPREEEYVQGGVDSVKKAKQGLCLAGKTELKKLPLQEDDVIMAEEAGLNMPHQGP